MAEPDTEAKTAPKPSVAAKAEQEIAAVKTGHDPLRPFRYARAFIGGTLQDGLDGMARYGRKGLWVGMGLGAIAAVALSSLIVPLTIGTLGGLALGMLGGGAKGFITGGYKSVARMHRGEIYAEDLVQRKKIQTIAPPSRTDYRAAYNARQNRNAYVTQQVLERVNENTSDFNTYWRNFVSGAPNNPGRGF